MENKSVSSKRSRPSGPPPVLNIPGLENTKEMITTSAPEEPEPEKTVSQEPEPEETAPQEVQLLIEPDKVDQGQVEQGQVEQGQVEPLLVDDSSKKTISKNNRITERRKKPTDIYVLSIITRKIIMNIRHVGSRLKENLEEKIKSTLEGVCVVEGFIKPGSTKVVTYSSGVIKGANVYFETVIECLICNPVEGMIIGCNVKNITKAGIRAELNITPSPIIVFVARDHNYMNPYFNTITEGSDIRIRVTGQRFKLNDNFISVIAELVDDRSKNRHSNKQRPKLVIE